MRKLGSSFNSTGKAIMKKILNTCFPLWQKIFQTEIYRLPEENLQYDLERILNEIKVQPRHPDLSRNAFGHGHPLFLEGCRKQFEDTQRYFSASHQNYYCPARLLHTCGRHCRTFKPETGWQDGTESNSLF